MLVLKPHPPVLCTFLLWLNSLIFENLPGERLNYPRRFRRHNIQLIDSMLATYRLHQIGSHKPVDPRYKYVHLLKLKSDFILAKTP